jgi:hypothetical protein
MPTPSKPFIDVRTRVVSCTRHVGDITAGKLPLLRAMSTGPAPFDVCYTFVWRPYARIIHLYRSEALYLAGRKADTYISSGEFAYVKYVHA